MQTNNGHWYTKTGTPCHTQKTKPGAKNPIRPTNISDAKRLGLLPSVSGYTKMLASTGLEIHKMREVAKACFNSPPHPGEEIDTYVKSMMENAGKDVAQAADLGTLVHKAIEDHFLGKPCWDSDVTLSTGATSRLSDLVNPAIEKFNSLNLQVSFAEKVLTSPKRGYAGTTDIVWRSDSELGILDWKSKRTKEGEEVRPIDTHPMQIAAYIVAHYGEDVIINKFDGTRGYNVYVSTTQPGRVDVVEYGPEELHKAFEAFDSCCQLWRYVNGYDPRDKDVD